MRFIVMAVSVSCLALGCESLAGFVEVDPETGRSPLGQGLGATANMLQDVGGGVAGWVIGGLGALATGLTVMFAAKKRIDDRKRRGSV